MHCLEKKIFDVIQAPHVASLATITEEGHPWARSVVARGDEGMVLRIATAKAARKVQHILHNPNVHMSCGSNSLTDLSPYMQVVGTASIDDSAEMKQAFWNPGLYSYFSGPEDPNYVVLTVRAEHIEYCAPENPMEPEVWSRCDA